ncbi:MULTISPECIES: phage integrase SAM-like domain-containing protein [Lactobacillus]|uniref:phage integrase SAM-like domain-containing protein n=1 Tax=Lactobacillus TaxID=1578 RepID=UPI0024918137|nr:MULTISPECIES: phage integrase SAM-like domain-containing protein [Lactobacillus]
MYPYQKNLNEFLQMQHSSKSAIDNSNKSVSAFWAFYTANAHYEATLENVNAETLRTFLDYLMQEKHYKSSTALKYATYLKKYFHYLYVHNIIKNYPIADLKFPQKNRKRTVIVGWIKYMPRILKDDQISETLKEVLLAIGSGYEPRELCDLKTSTVLSNKNSPLHEIIVKSLWHFENVKKAKNDTYFVLDKFGRKYSSYEAINNHINLQDKGKLNMPLGLKQLRTSYIFTFVSNEKFSDEELMDKLHLSKKSLAYYKTAIQKDVELVDFKQEFRSKNN